MDTAPPRMHRILLVEDSDIDAELIGVHLERGTVCHELIRARNRADFDRLIADPHLDLILADYSLPDFDGLQALEIAKVRRPDVPLVFVSGVGGEDLATDALRRGATDYVVKRNLARLAGSIARALAETRERVQRREAEAALVKSEANMRLALDAATLGLWQLRGDEQITWHMSWDQRCAAMLGLEPRGAAYGHVLELVHQDDRDEFDHAMQAALDPASEDVLAHECRFVAGDGDVRWIVLRGRRLDSETADVRMTGVMQDVTATRTLESRQRHAEILFKLAAQATGLGVWEIGPVPDQIWVDDGYRRIAGLATSGYGALQVLIDEVVHPDDRVSLVTALDAAFVAGGVDTVGLEHRLVRPREGDVRWIAVQGRRIVGIDGRIRLVGTARDITDQRRAQKALLESNEGLERRVAERTRELTSEIAERARVEDTLRQMQRLEAVGQLTAGVAHDFNNLLTVVLSNISLIGRLLPQRGEPDARIVKRLESMREAANRGAALTRQLLAFSRRQRLEPQTIDFNDIVVGMRDLLQTTLGGSVHLVTELGADAWPALVDVTQMELVILNLAINARDAMEVGGRLTLRTANATLLEAPRRPEEAEPGEYVVLSVSDTGSGMSDEVLAKAFEPFFTTKEVGKGSGLGLAQVFGFAKQSGGGVRIETRLGVGTTVQVYMPRSLESAAAAPVSMRALPGDDDGGRGRTLLVVDDDHAVREATASLLALHGYHVEEAADAASALRRLAQPEPIDLVLLDFAMPRMNGAEMAQVIREQRPGLPIVFLTGYADLRSLQHVNERFLLQKPIREAELVERLREALLGADAMH